MKIDGKFLSPDERAVYAAAFAECANSLGLRVPAQESPDDVDRAYAHRIHSDASSAVRLFRTAQAEFPELGASAEAEISTLRAALASLKSKLSEVKEKGAAWYAAHEAAEDARAYSEGGPYGEHYFTREYPSSLGRGAREAKAEKALRGEKEASENLLSVLDSIDTV